MTCESLIIEVECLAFQVAHKLKCSFVVGLSTSCDILEHENELVDISIIASIETFCGRMFSPSTRDYYVVLVTLKTLEKR